MAPRRKTRSDKGKARKRSIPGPKLVRYDYYEVMELGYLPTIQDAIDGTGTLQAWELFQAGFRTAEQWIHNHLEAEGLVQGERVK